MGLRWWVLERSTEILLELPSNGRWMLSVDGSQHTTRPRSFPWQSPRQFGHGPASGRLAMGARRIDKVQSEYEASGLIGYGHDSMVTKTEQASTKPGLRSSRFSHTTYATNYIRTGSDSPGVVPVENGACSWSVSGGWWGGWWTLAADRPLATSPREGVAYGASLR